MSKLLEWYGKDFGKDMKSRLTHLGSYLAPSQRQMLAEMLEKGKTRVKFKRYDWNTNEQSPFTEEVRRYLMCCCCYVILYNRDTNPLPNVPLYAIEERRISQSASIS